MPYADLVLAGGGVKGIALVGAVSVLEERGYHFKRIAGTSAGAVVGSLLAAGVGSQRLREIMKDVDYRRFPDGHLGGRLLGLLVRQGAHPGRYVQQWLAEQLRLSAGVSSFQDLRYQDDERPLPREKQYRLVVTACDIGRGRLVHLPWDYDHYGRDRDSQNVAEAVRASISIPFFYQPVRWDVPGEGTTPLVDGGLSSCYPIDVFDAPPSVEPRWPTLGIKLSPSPAAQIINPTAGLWKQSLAMLDTMRGFFDRMHIEDSGATDRTIFVDTGDVEATDFGLTPETQEKLFAAGRTAATTFLEGGPHRPGWDFPAYLAKHRSGIRVPDDT